MHLIFCHARSKNGQMGEGLPAKWQAAGTGSKNVTPRAHFHPFTKSLVQPHSGDKFINYTDENSSSATLLKKKFMAVCAAFFKSQKEIF
jgi:hypothetical protein